MNSVSIIGGGLAGCEAALQLASQGVEVTLYEMRPKRNTPAHKTENLAELVCSNSFKGLNHTSAHGLLKEELRRRGSFLIRCAFASRVEAGESLAVDRELFARNVAEAIESSPQIRIVREEQTEIDPEKWTLVATGPLTSDALSARLTHILGSQKLRFFDSIAPVVEFDSVDMKSAFFKNRWEKGETPDFINCPLNRPTYETFIKMLCEADRVEPKPFEKGELFEGCLPVEELAKRGPETLRFGPMRPVGLRHPETGEKPYAVIQLRAENRQKSIYNLVGFQTRLKWGTQKRIFSFVPALRNAQFVRYGAMHRNTFIDSPNLLDSQLRFPGSRLFFAGQITGAEGYTEAIATGLYAAKMLGAALRSDPAPEWPETSALFSLVRHLTEPHPHFQPMNFNFGLLPKPAGAHKKERKGKQIEACLRELDPLTTLAPLTEKKESLSMEQPGYSD